MEDHISVSSDTPDFEGFDETDFVPRRSIPGGSTLAPEPLVYNVTRDESLLLISSVSSPVPDNSREHLFRSLFIEPRPTRVDFLRQVFESRHSKEIANLLVQKLRQSSMRQYQTVWTSFLTFLHKSQPTTMNDNVVLEYLTSLFNEGRALATVKTYKAALHRPLLEAFGLEINDTVFSDLVRVFSLKRPARRTPRISWSLNKVLDMLILQPYTDPNVDNHALLKKTILLVSLACGARIGEIAALRRGKDFIYPMGDDICVSPSQDFLAKNENPQMRRGPIRIRALGQSHPLCPVRALKLYLERTAQVKDGQLFVHHVSQKPLTNKGISSAVISLIKLANPETFPKFHDIRKYATTIAFLNEATFLDITEYTGWSSIRVFLSFYRKELESLNHSVISAGTRASVTSHH